LEDALNWKDASASPKDESRSAGPSVPLTSEGLRVIPEMSSNRLAGKQKSDMANMVRLVYNLPMHRVNLSDLKARLSAHIQLVRNGEEVVVCDRNKPVARIVPCRLVDYSEQERRLLARGVITPPLKKRPASVSWPQPPGNVSDEVMERVWREERESR
jgi:prevent-host-death family protein